MLGPWQLIAVELLQMLLRAQGPLTGNSITFLFRVSWWSCANTLRNNVTSCGTMCELLDYNDLLDMNYL